MSMILFTFFLNIKAKKYAFITHFSAYIPTDYLCVSKANWKITAIAYNLYLSIFINQLCQKYLLTGN